MSEREKPDFLVGLPQRALLDDMVIVPEGRRTPRRLLWVVITPLVLLALIASATLLPRWLAVGEEPSLPAPAATLSADEQKAVDEGGAAVPGHSVSTELCAAVAAVNAVGTAAAAEADTSARLVAELEELAAVESPYQQKYQAYLGMTKAPASIASEKAAQAIASDFAKALQIDVTTCA